MIQWNWLMGLHYIISENRRKRVSELFLYVKRRGYYCLIMVMI